MKTIKFSAVDVGSESESWFSDIQVIGEQIHGARLRVG